MNPRSTPSANLAMTNPAPGFPWSPDQGDGTYCNPILCADYSDPDIIRHGEDFYLTASSFNCTPGLPILHSRDLVNWNIIGHAVKNLPHPRYDKVQAGCGIWAPAIRFHAGKFWIFFPMPDEGIYVTTAAHPGGPWSEPHLVEAGRGLIDPCPLWDADGQAYLVHAYAASRAGIKHLLRVRPMAPDGSRLLGEGQIVFHAPERHPTIEGPKFLKRNGWYYIFAPAGGVTMGWQVALRSKSIYGPYADKIVLEQGCTPVNGPHQGALVESAKGDWWFAHFQDAAHLGRIVHLQPVRWQDDWPLIGDDRDGNGIGEPVSRHQKPLATSAPGAIVPQTSDEFDARRLGLQWQWYANHHDNWFSLTTRPGWLRLFAQPVAELDLSTTPNLLLQKLPARALEAETLLDSSSLKSGDEAGLAMIGVTHAALTIRRTSAENQIVFRENGRELALGRAPSNPIRLRLRVSDGGQCTFSYSAGNEFERIRIPFQASAGVWIGAKLGLYAVSRQGTSAGFADFDYFRFSR